MVGVLQLTTYKTEVGFGGSAVVVKNVANDRFWGSPKVGFNGVSGGEKYCRSWVGKVQWWWVGKVLVRRIFDEGS